MLIPCCPNCFSERTAHGEPYDGSPVSSSLHRIDGGDETPIYYCRVCSSRLYEEDLEYYSFEQLAAKMQQEQED